MKTLKIFVAVILAAIFMSGCGAKSYDFSTMANEDIVALYNESPKFHKGDIDEMVGNVRILDSVVLEEEAASIFSEEFENDYNVITQYNKIFEDEKYLLFDVTWLYLEQQEYNQRCLLFKKDFYDTVSKTFGKASPTAIKEVFDLRNYAYIVDEDEAKMLQSNVKKEGNNYIYQMYILHKGQDLIFIEEARVTVDAQTGVVTDETYSAVKENIR